MAIELQVPGLARAGHRLLVSASQSQAPGDQVTLSLRRPSLGERFGRATANLFTLGLWTRSQNRDQWALFQSQVVASAPALANDNAKDKLGQVFDTYKNQRITRTRAANVLAEVDRLRHGADLQPRSPRTLNASGNLVVRAWRTVQQMLGPRGQQVTDLRTYAHHKLNSDQSKEDYARAMLQVLRPGRPIDSGAIKLHGQSALAKHAQAQGVVFESYHINNNLRTNLPALADSQEWKDFSASAQAQPGSPCLFAVPLGLEGARNLLYENHSVLLAVDPNSQKIMYFDAKADSMATASRVYGNVRDPMSPVGPDPEGDLELAVTTLGKKLFGDDWNAQTGVLTLTLAKQQGANDCGAFTHTFTRWLIDGKSLGDIERSFTATDRRKMRVEMAEDIRKHLIGDERPIDQALNDLPVLDEPVVASGAQAARRFSEGFEVVGGDADQISQISQNSQIDGDDFLDVQPDPKRV